MPPKSGPPLELNFFTQSTTYGSSSDWLRSVAFFKIPTETFLDRREVKRTKFNNYGKTILNTPRQ